MKTYHHGVPGFVIWLTHILVGLLLIYVGYTTLHKEPLHQFISNLLMGLGTIVILYHGYLLFKNRK